MIDDEIDFTNTEMLRRKAEAKLNEKKKNEKLIPENDINRLMHELQVHQIELEMQNDELRLAYETAEVALKKYTVLYDFSPMGYFTLDSECHICDLNFTGADMLGERRFSLINNNFKLFISEDTLPVFKNFYKKVHASNVEESCEVMLGYNKDSFRPIYIKGIVIGEDKRCLLSVVDISDLKK